MWQTLATHSIATVDSLRVLRAALDQVEETDGYWHKASASAVAALERRDEQKEY